MSYDRYKWQKRKYYIRINCWIIIAILVAILCFMFPIVSDAAEAVPIPEGYTSFADYFNVDPSNIYGNDIYEVPQGCVSPFNYDFSHEYLVGLFDNDMSNGEVIIDNDFLEHEIVYTVDNQSYSVFDFSDYIMTYMGVYDYFQVRLCNAGFSSESFNPNLIFSPNGLYFGSLYNFDYERSFSGYVYPSTVINSTKLAGYPSNIYVFNLSTFGDYAFGYTDVEYFGQPSTDPNAVYTQRLIGGTSGQGNTLISTNSPFVYTINPSERNGGTDWIYNDQGVLRSNIYGSPWYQIGPSHVPDDDNTYPDGSGGTDENNLYMRTADWQFNIPKYWGSVNSTLVQSRYTQNWGSGNIIFYGLINDYQIDNSDHFNLVFNFNIWCQGHHFSSVQSNIDENFHNTFKTSNIVVSLSDFVENNNTLSFNVSDIFDSAISPYNGINCTEFINEIKTYESIDNWKWIITCDAFLSTADQSDRSGDIVEEYNFISQVSSEKANTITDNHDPYYPENGLPNDDDSSSITNKDGSIILTNNDNDVINFNSNDKTVINTLVDKLVPADTSGETGLTQDFIELTNANNWFTVLNTALPILGVQFWNTVKIIFIAFLGIIGTAFALWIICHII